MVQWLGLSPHSINIHGSNTTANWGLSVWSLYSPCSCMGILWVLQFPSPVQRVSCPGFRSPAHLYAHLFVIHSYQDFLFFLFVTRLFAGVSSITFKHKHLLYKVYTQKMQTKDGKTIFHCSQIYVVALIKETNKNRNLKYTATKISLNEKMACWQYFTACILIIVILI